MRTESKQFAIAGATLLMGIAGCDALIGFLQPRTVTIRLVNNSDFDVDVEMYTHDEQNVAEFLITEVGDRIDRTVSAGEATTILGDCDDVQAIIIEDADLLAVGGLGPEANTDVIRDGSDFGCGDTVTFTFDHSALITDFDVSVDVTPSF